VDDLLTAFTSVDGEMTPTFGYLTGYLNAWTLKRISMRSQKQVKS